MTKKTLPVFITCALFSSPLLAGVDIEISGVKGSVKDNVEAYISSIPESEYSTGLRFQSQLEKSLTESLNALGYYHPKFSFSVSEKKDELKVNIDKGPVTRLKEVEVIISGEAQSDKDFLAFLKKKQPKTGDRLNHSKYDSLKSGLRTLTLQKGYFDAEFTVSRLEVIPENNEAFIRLHLDSGQRYRFGQSIITGSQIDENRVLSLQPFKEGDPYLVNNVAQYNQNLSNTDWFSSVFVEPDLSVLGKEYELPMKVSLSPQARNQFETGLGYSTDVGVRGSFKWKKPWVNSRGHSFDSSISLSSPEQSVTAGYQIPLDDVLRQYYRIQYGMKKVDNRDTKSLESNLSLERHWLLDNGWHRTIYTRYLMENYTQGVLDDVAHFVLPGVTYTRTRVRGEKTIMWGDKQSITLEYGDPALLSETRVVRVLGTTSWIRSAGNNNRGLLRLDGAANVSEEYDKLSPSLRFFAGGDNSIRGYGYQSISPKDESGSLSGAKYMMTSSLEYQHRLTGNWWGALFVDYGDAFNETFAGKTGTGFGVRWVSPVGPVRIDFAWGLDEDPGNRFRIHFSLGPEL